MKMRADECSSPPGLMCVDQGAGKRKAGPLLGGGSQRAPGLTMIRLYYRDGPERIPQMSDFFAESKKYATRRPPPKSRRVAHQPRLLSAETPVSGPWSHGISQTQY